MMNESNNETIASNVSCTPFTAAVYINFGYKTLRAKLVSNAKCLESGVKQRSSIQVT
jgi:hypothetical protein